MVARGVVGEKDGRRRRGEGGAAPPLGRGVAPSERGKGEMEGRHRLQGEGGAMHGGGERGAVAHGGRRWAERGGKRRRAGRGGARWWVGRLGFLTLATCFIGGAAPNGLGRAFFVL